MEIESQNKIMKGNVEKKKKPDTAAKEIKKEKKLMI